MLADAAGPLGCASTTGAPTSTWMAPHFPLARIGVESPPRLRCHRHDQPARGEAAAKPVALATMAMITDYDCWKSRRNRFQRKS
jgi:hypothetical protein